MYRSAPINSGLQQLEIQIREFDFRITIVLDLATWILILMTISLVLGSVTGLLMLRMQIQKWNRWKKGIYSGNDLRNHIIFHAEESWLEKITNLFC
uniref:Uncharacterized protein n=1 Tax=Panagrolaimus sp. JU765 TaxID=591449 RepID=A0AC34QZ08_9BILA